MAGRWRALVSRKAGYTVTLSFLAGACASTPRVEFEQRPEPCFSKGQPVFVDADTRLCLGAADLLEGIFREKMALAFCADEQHMRARGESGKLVLRFIVETSGNVSSVEVASLEGANTYFATCTTHVFKRLRFPRHREKGSPVVFPLKY